MQIYIARQGRQTGPFTEEQTRDMLSSGSITTTDLAWTDGLSDWKPLHEILTLPTPPPLPDVIPWNPSDGPKGIGGWLLFYCICLCILGPIYGLLQLLGNWTLASASFAVYPQLKTAVLLENSGNFIIIVYGLIVGCLLWREHSRARQFIRQYLIIRLICLIGVEILAFTFLVNLPSKMIATTFGALLGASLREGVYFAIWWSYFKLSKRVRNTFGPEKK